METRKHKTSITQTKQKKEKGNEVMNFSMEVKTLKGMIEKASCVCNKNSVIQDFHMVCFKVDDDGKLIITCQSEKEQIRIYHILASKEFTVGEVMLDIDDIQTITKLKGTEDIIFRTVDKNGTVNVIVTCGKRKVELTALEGTLTQSYDWKKCKMSMEINTDWFIKTINNLDLFTSKDKDDKRISLKAFNFNFMTSKIESTDNYRLAIRDFGDNVFVNFNDKVEDNTIIPNFCVRVFKKIKKIKSDTITIIESDDCIHFSTSLDEGVFEYSCKKIKGKFYNIKQLLSSVENSKMVEFFSDTNDMLDILEYNKNFIKKNDRKPMIFEKENDYSLAISYVNSNGIKISDSLGVNIIKCDNDDFRIGFNPQFLNDCFKILKDSFDKMFYAYFSSINGLPLVIEHDDYTFMIFGISIKNKENKEVA